MPANQVVRHDAVDEQGEFVAALPLTPLLLPVFDHGLDAGLVFVRIAPVGLDHGRPQEWGCGQLLRFAEPAGDLHFHPTRRFHRRFL
jgi:hypothetical protein